MSLACFFAACVVIYLFYAKLRDIADDVRRLRIAYDLAHAPENRSKPRPEERSQSAWPPTPKPLIPPEDEKYLPKK